MKKDNGITLVALIITIIVLLIISTISIGNITHNKGGLKLAHNEVLLYELAEVQQAVLELNLKYNQTGAQSYLEGTKIEYSEANQKLQEIVSETGETLSLKYTYSDGDSIADNLSYYKLETKDLKNMGLVNSEDEYIVNYSTGEVFNITAKKTSDGVPLYKSK